MKTAITLLEADTPALLDRCLTVRQAVFTGELGVPAEVERDSRDCLDGECRHFLITRGGQDIGAVRCLPQADGTLRLQRFCIRRDCPGSGRRPPDPPGGGGAVPPGGVLGSGTGCKMFGPGFYTACGYETVSGPFLEAGVLHVAMQRPL